MDTKNISKPHSITLKERKSMTVTGVTEIIKFDENCVSLDISDFQLNVEGQELKIEAFSTEQGDVCITGHIDSIIYLGTTQESYRRGFLKRIFSYDDR
jgi:sporulation protein YabP